MKVPAPPPSRDELLQKLTNSPKDLLRLVSAIAEQPDRYLPWDKLRYQSPPEGLTVEEWWLAIKVTRKSMQRELPLTDVSGWAFRYALPDEVLRLTDQISQRASGRIATPEQVTNPATRDRYFVSSLMEEAITSSQLEGASTSRREAKELLRSGRQPRTRSERMILNNYLAMRRVVELKDEQFSADLICELHRIVTDGTLDNPDAAGRFQENPDPNDRVAVWDEANQLLHRPPPVDQLTGRIDRLCHFANDDGSTGRWMPPVLRAITVHFMLGYDHYFEDGNGRIARICFYWSMLKQGFWLTEFLTISKILKGAPSQYARSFVLTEQDEGDLTYFYIYHLEVINRALDDLDEYLARKAAELRDTRVLLSSTPGEYNHRQLALLELAIKQPGSIFSAISHAKSHNVSSETARTDLNDLENRGLLRRGKAGKQFIWIPLPDFAETLKRRASQR